MKPSLICCKIDLATVCFVASASVPWTEPPVSKLMLWSGTQSSLNLVWLILWLGRKGCHSMWEGCLPPPSRGNDCWGEIWRIVGLIPKTDERGREMFTGLRGPGKWNYRGDSWSSHAGMKRRVWHRGENRNWLIQRPLKHIDEFGAWADGNGK